MGKQLYALRLNGQLYGKGDWKYMQELMNDWVDDCDMYGDVEVDFKIVKTKSRGDLDV